MAEQTEKAFYFVDADFFVDAEFFHQRGKRLNQIRSCAICFEAPKYCFFIPYGHCVACFGCANRILETSATCLICRRKIRKAKRIYSV